MATSDNEDSRTATVGRKHFRNEEPPEDEQYPQTLLGLSNSAPSKRQRVSYGIENESPPGESSTLHKVRMDQATSKEQLSSFTTGEDYIAFDVDEEHTYQPDTMDGQDKRATKGKKHSSQKIRVKISDDMKNMITAHEKSLAMKIRSADKQHPNLKQMVEEHHLALSFRVSPPQVLVGGGEKELIRLHSTILKYLAHNAGDNVWGILERQDQLRRPFDYKEVDLIYLLIYSDKMSRVRARNTLEITPLKVDDTIFASKTVEMERTYDREKWSNILKKLFDTTWNMTRRSLIVKRIISGVLALDDYSIGIEPKATLTSVTNDLTESDPPSPSINVIEDYEESFNDEEDARDDIAMMEKRKEESDDDMRHHSSMNGQLQPMPIFPEGSRSYLRDLTREERRLQGRYWNRFKADDLARCLVCSENGHMEETCPSKEVICEHCKSVDLHFSHACPLWLKCPKCGERGHRQSNCPSRLMRSHADGVSCDMCNTEGHKEEECSWLWRTYKPDTSSTRKIDNMIMNCYQCSAPNHWGDDCPFRDLEKRVNIPTFSNAEASIYVVPGFVPAPLPTQPFRPLPPPPNLNKKKKKPRSKSKTNGNNNDGGLTIRGRAAQNTPVNPGPARGSIKIKGITSQLPPSSGNRYDSYVPVPCASPEYYAPLQGYPHGSRYRDDKGGFGQNQPPLPNGPPPPLQPSMRGGGSGRARKPRHRARGRGK